MKTERGEGLQLIEEEEAEAELRRAGSASGETLASPTD